MDLLEQENTLFKKGQQNYVFPYGHIIKKNPAINFVSQLLFNQGAKKWMPKYSSYCWNQLVAIQVCQIRSSVEHFLTVVLQRMQTCEKSCTGYQYGSIGIYMFDVVSPYYNQFRASVQLRSSASAPQDKRCG